MRTYYRLAAGLGVIFSLGLISNQISVESCTLKTRRRIEIIVAGMEGGQRPIDWLPRSQLIDKKFPPRSLAWLKPARLVPGLGAKGTYPWAYAEPLVWGVPFVVRIANGFATHGQAGGTAITYYLAFFGWSSEGTEAFNTYF